MKKIAAFFLMAALSSLSLTAMGNDSTIAESNGTIVFLKDADVSMEKERLFLSEELVQVDYIFQNHGGKMVEALMAFPMPPMFFGDMDHDEIKDFKLWVNDAPVKTNKKLVILLDRKKDVTAELNRLGWSAKDLIQFLSNNREPLPGKKPLPKAWNDKDGFSRLTVNEFFVWQQRFEPGLPVSVRHIYVPGLSSSVPQSARDMLKYHQADHCLDTTTRQLLNRLDSQRTFIEWAALGYILLTGNNWAGPIKDFQLIIKKKHASDTISLCFKDELKKQDALTFTFSQTNYQPQRNLNILFFRKSSYQEQE